MQFSQCNVLKFCRLYLKLCTLSQCLQDCGPFLEWSIASYTFAKGVQSDTSGRMFSLWIYGSDCYIVSLPCLQLCFGDYDSCESMHLQWNTGSVKSMLFLRGNNWKLECTSVALAMLSWKCRGQQPTERDKGSSRKAGLSGRPGSVGQCLSDVSSWLLDNSSLFAWAINDTVM